MSFFLRTLALSVLLLAAAELTAEVYLKGPRIGRMPKGQGIPGRSFLELADQKLLMTEKVVCNGVATEVKVSLIAGELAELLRELLLRIFRIPGIARLAALAKTVLLPKTENQ